MATVKKHVSKDGKITYYIRVFNGFDGNGKKIEPSLAWKVPEGMKPKQIEKELQRQIMKFEEEVKNGSFFNDKTKFATYANNWLENNQPPLLAPKTYERYRAMLDRINERLGEHQLTKLQSHHIQEFYNSLRKDGAKKGWSLCNFGIAEECHETEIFQQR